MFSGWLEVQSQREAAFGGGRRAQGEASADDLHGLRENALLDFQGKEILSGKGSVSNDQAEVKAREEYEVFDARRKRFDAIQADQDDLKELEELSASRK